MRQSRPDPALQKIYCENCGRALTGATGRGCRTARGRGPKGWSGSGTGRPIGRGRPGLFFSSAERIPSFIASRSTSGRAFSAARVRASCAFFRPASTASGSDTFARNASNCPVRARRQFPLRIGEGGRGEEGAQALQIGFQQGLDGEGLPLALPRSGPPRPRSAHASSTLKEQYLSEEIFRFGSLARSRSNTRAGLLHHLRGHAAPVPRLDELDIRRGEDERCPRRPMKTSSIRARYSLNSGIFAVDMVEAPQGEVGVGVGDGGDMGGQQGGEAAVATTKGKGPCWPVRRARIPSVRPI